MAVYWDLAEPILSSPMREIFSKRLAAMALYCSTPVCERR